MPTNSNLENKQFSRPLNGVGYRPGSSARTLTNYGVFFYLIRIKFKLKNIKTIF